MSSSLRIKRPLMLKIVDPRCRNHVEVREEKPNTSTTASFYLPHVRERPPNPLHLQPGHCLSDSPHVGSQPAHDASQFLIISYLVGRTAPDRRMHHAMHGDGRSAQIQPIFQRQKRAHNRKPVFQSGGFQIKKRGRIGLRVRPNHFRQVGRARAAERVKRRRRLGVVVTTVVCVLVHT